MNLYAILIVVVMWGASLGGSFFYGQSVGKDSEVAAVAREDAIVKKTIDAAQIGAAKAIAANKPRNVTIRQDTEYEVRTNTVYADCRHSPEQLQRVNSALTGTAAASASGRVVPKAQSVD